MNHQITVRPAELADIEQMMEICEQNLVENISSKNDFSKTGFLVKKLTFVDAQKMIEDKQNYYVCVAENNNEILGYLIGCDVKISKTNFPENIFDFKNEKIFYHKQIVKKVGTKNIGEKLLFSMFDEARNRGYLRVICRIVHQPFFNQASISFHQKFGFEKISEITENERTLGIYFKILT